MKNIQSEGGKARAKSLSKAERSRIAKLAAQERWNSDLPVAAYEGDFNIGDKKISSVVLPNGLRVISQSTFQTALGRTRTVKAGYGLQSGVNLPYFLQSRPLQPFITDELAMASIPVFYRTKTGGKGMGYDARLLPKVAEVYLKYRDKVTSGGGVVPKRYENMVRAADILMRGLADVGIIALVDEATGYQDVRAKDALAKILEKFVAKELQPYVKTFPVDFYKHLFRLRGIEYPTNKVTRPRYFGHITNDIIYARLAPGVIDELKRKSERDKKGNLKHHMHRQLTRDFGHPELREHVASVVTLMKISDNYKSFHDHVDKIHPRYNTNLSLELYDEDGKGI